MGKFYWVCSVGRNGTLSQVEKGNCFFVYYKYTPHLLFYFIHFKLRNVVIENENTLNIQFFYLKWKRKISPMTGWRGFIYCSLSYWVKRRHTTVTEIKIMWGEKRSKKRKHGTFENTSKKTIEMFNISLTILLIVIQLGCLTCIFRIHCYMEMTFLKLS